MLGLFGTLNLASRSLQNQQLGLETSGHNLANVNNSAYARQRVRMETSVTLATPLGPQGTGSQAVAIQQLRDYLVDRRIVDESSVLGYWQAQQQAMSDLQSALGQSIDRLDASAAAAGSAPGLAEKLQDFFSALQSVAASPTSLAERQVLLQNAQALAAKFNQLDSQVANVTTNLNETLAANAAKANDLLAGIAALNHQIARLEAGDGGTANDLRDARQQQLETLAGLVKINANEDAEGRLTIAIGGEAMVDGQTVVNTLETYDAGDGRMLLRTAAGTPLSAGGGAMQGMIEARDGSLLELRGCLDGLAGQLISEVNTLHSGGFSLTSATGLDFFTGTRAADIRLNPALANEPALIQAAGMGGAAGDNQVALALARLADQPLTGLKQQTFAQYYAHTVANVGEALAGAEQQVSDQEAISKVLQNQRASVSGVSLDEEMADMLKYQKAYQASAKLISTLDELLDTLMGMKR